MWSAVIAAVAALGGVALGAALEPLRLRFARRERIRQERLAQSAALLVAANHVAVVWSTIFRLVDTATEAYASGQFNDTLITLERHRSELRAAVGLLTLYGPDALADAANAIANADSDLAQTAGDLGGTMVNGSPRPPVAIDQAVQSARRQVIHLAARIKLFVAAASDHVS